MIDLDATAHVRHSSRDDCLTVLTGRAKKCEPCRTQTFVHAKKVLLGLERAS